MKVLVARDGGGFHVDSLELYSARQRGHFVKFASQELGVEELGSPFFSKLIIGWPSAIIDNVSSDLSLELSGEAIPTQTASLADAQADMNTTRFTFEQHDRWTACTLNVKGPIADQTYLANLRSVGYASCAAGALYSSVQCGPVCRAVLRPAGGAPGGVQRHHYGDLRCQG